MNIFAVLSPYALFLKLGAVAAFLAAVFFGGWWVNGWRWEVKYQKLDAQYQTFSAGVAKLGEQAKAKNAIQALADLKTKERTDEANKRQHTADINTILRLRSDRARAGGGTVPAAPAGSGRPDLACFDRSALESAYGKLVEGVRGLADEGAAATVDLNTVKQWKKEIDQGVTQ